MILEDEDAEEHHSLVRQWVVNDEFRTCMYVYENVEENVPNKERRAL